MMSDAKPSSNPDQDPRALVGQILRGRITAALLHATVRLELPDHLASGPKTAAELAKLTGGQEQPMLRFLRAAVSTGILTELPDGRFGSGPMCSVLRADTPSTVRDFVLFEGDEWHVRCWANIPLSIRTGRPATYDLFGKSLWELLSEQPDAAASFNSVMSLGSRADADAIVNAYDFSRFSHVVDVGGGLGTLLATILERSPGIRGTLFELPYIIEQARSSPPLANVTDRCELVGGSFLERVPHGADAYVMKHIIHDWDDDTARRILANCRAALKPDGVLLIADRVFDPARPMHALVDLEMLICAGGRERTEADWRALFKDTGLRLERIVPTAGNLSLLELTLA